MLVAHKATGYLATNVTTAVAMLATEAHMAKWRTARRRGRVLGTVAAIVLLTGMLSSAASTAEEPDPHEKHDEYVEQYGDIGCRVVPGFNDRCPSMISEPYHPPDSTISSINLNFHYSAGNPDGRMVYAAGWQHNRDDSGSGRAEAVVVAYHTIPDDPAMDGTIAWAQPLPEPGAVTDATDIDVSHDGRIVYVTGYSHPSPRPYVPYEGWIAALDAASGDLLWKRSIRDDLIGADSQVVPGVPATPSVQAWEVAVSADDSRVAVSASVVYPFGYVIAELAQSAWNAWYFALDAKSGELAWKHQYTERMPHMVGREGDSLAFSPDGSRLYAQLPLYSRIAELIGIGTIAFDVASGNLLWDRAYLYRPDDGVQNPSAGLIVDPKGGTVVVAGTRSFRDPATDKRIKSFLLIAYETADGRRAWSAEFPSTHTACSTQALGITTPGRALAMSPSGKLLYLVGEDGNHRGGCTWNDAVLGPRVLAVQTTTGRLVWDELLIDAAGKSCIGAWWCDIAVVPGPSGGDERSRVIISTDFARHEASFWYPMVTALDANTGEGLWQARYLDTHRDGNTEMYARGSPVVSDGDWVRVYTMFSERSKTRGWQSAPMLVMGYDVG